MNKNKAPTNAPSVTPKIVYAEIIGADNPRLTASKAKSIPTMNFIRASSTSDTAMEANFPFPARYPLSTPDAVTKVSAGAITNKDAAEYSLPIKLAIE